MRVAILSDMDVPREGIRVWVAAGGHDVVHSGPLTAFDSGVSGAGADVAILVTYPDGNSVSYGYDSQGNLATETDGNGDEMKYVWDQAGNLASVTYPDGNTVAYAYDGQGRMSSLTDWLGNTTGFKYDSGGNLTETDYPNSTVTTYGYDSAERLNKIATTKSGVAQFSFDASGSNGSLNPDGSIKKFSTVQIAGYNLTPGSSGGAGTDTYTYDPLSRMTADTQTGTGSASISSSFNNNGEIATTNGGGPQNGTYGHDTTGSDAGQLNSITSGSNVTSFGYNGQGDTTSCAATTGTPCSGAGSAAYTFDEENRLIKETDSLKGPETMLYDGNGLLQQEKETIPGPCPAIVKGAVKRHAPAPTTASPSLSCLYTDQLTWSTALGDPTLASTHTWSSSLDLGTTDYVMGPDGQPVEQLTTLGTSTTPEWYYADFQGNTRVLMDASGSPQVTYNYPAWGATTDWLGDGNGTPLQYNATFTDQWTGLVYDQARWYDPSTGQFVSQDPLVHETVQPYAYAGDSPIAVAAAALVPSRLCRAPGGRAAAAIAETSDLVVVAGGGGAGPKKRQDLSLGNGWLCMKRKLWKGLSWWLDGVSKGLLIGAPVFDGGHRAREAYKRWPKLKEVAKGFKRPGAIDTLTIIAMALGFTVGWFNNEIQTKALRFKSYGACFHWYWGKKCDPTGHVCIPWPDWRWTKWKG